MSNHLAVNIVRKQFESHMEVLESAASPAEKAALYRNLSKHLKAWGKTLEKEADAQESLTLSAAKKRCPALEAA